MRRNAGEDESQIFVHLVTAGRHTLYVFDSLTMSTTYEESPGDGLSTITLVGTDGCRISTDADIDTALIRMLSMTLERATTAETALRARPTSDAVSRARRAGYAEAIESVRDSLPASPADDDLDGC